MQIPILGFNGEIMELVCYNTSNDYIPVAALMRPLVLQLRGAKAMSNSITIPLSKTGKYAGQFEAIVSLEDKELLDFNWTVDIGRSTNYATRMIYNGTTRTRQRMHIVILEKMLDRPLKEGMVVDHIDGNGLNNQRNNLREATPTQNKINGELRADSMTGFKGVKYCPDVNKWMARIGINGTRKYLGLFPTPEEAYKAYCEEADKIHEDFANYGKFKKKE